MRVVGFYMEFAYHLVIFQFFFVQDRVSSCPGWIPTACVVKDSRAQCRLSSGHLIFLNLSTCWQRALCVSGHRTGETGKLEKIASFECRKGSAGWLLLEKYMFEEIKLAWVLGAQSNLVSKCVLASPCCSEKPDEFFFK